MVVLLLDWSENCPDINFIEHLWHVMRITKKREERDRIIEDI